MVILLIQKVGNAQGLFSQVITPFLQTSGTTRQILVSVYKEKACMFDKHHPMKTYGGMFHAFLTATLPAVEWLAFRVGRRINRVSVPSCYWAGDCVGCSRSGASGEQEGLSLLLETERVPDPVCQVLRENDLLLYAV
jgi:hypothetical protein